MQDLDPNQPAGDDVVIGKFKTLTPEQVNVDLVAALEQACEQAEHDADIYRGSVHGQHMAALAKKWRDTLTSAKAARP